MSYKQTGYSSNFGYIPYTNLSANSGSGGSGVTNLNGLTDVTLSGITDDQVLRYDNASSKWVNEDDVSASNVGFAGVGVFKQRNGNDFEFKNINAGSNKITLFDDASEDELEIDVDETNLTLANMIGAPNGTIVGTTDVQTLTNKTIDGDLNTVTNIGDEELKAGINANKISSGVVSNTEFDYLNNVSSNIQTQLDGKSSTAHTHTIDDLSDVVAPAPADGDVLKWDNTTSQWINNPISTDVDFFDFGNISVNAPQERDMLSYVAGGSDEFQNMQPYLALGGDGTNSFVVGQNSSAVGVGDIVLGTASDTNTVVESNNTLVGNLNQTTLGSRNTIIGYENTVTGHDNCLVLGSGGVASSSNQLTISLNDFSSNWLQTNLDYSEVSGIDYLTCETPSGTRYIPFQLSTGQPSATSLATTTLDVDVSGSSVPTLGQVLTATSPSTATWQTPSAGGGGGSVPSGDPYDVICLDAAGTSFDANPYNAVMASRTGLTITGNYNSLVGCETCSINSGANCSINNSVFCDMKNTNTIPSFCSIHASNDGDIDGGLHSTVISSLISEIKRDTAGTFAMYNAIIASAFSSIVSNTSPDQTQQCLIAASYNCNIQNLQNCAVIGGSSVAGQADDSITTSAIYTVGGTVNTISDPKSKKNLEKSSFEDEDPKTFCDKMTKVELKKFRYKTDDDHAPLRYGFDADNVQEHFPEAVKTTFRRKRDVVLDNGVWKDDNGVEHQESDECHIEIDPTDSNKGKACMDIPLQFKCLDTMSLIHLLWMTNKKQQAMINNLETRIDALEKIKSL